MAAVFAVIVAAVPPIVADVAFDKLVPVIISDDPTHPLLELKLVITGAGVTVYVITTCPVPPTPPALLPFQPVWRPPPPPPPGTEHSHYPCHCSFYMHRPYHLYMVHC